MKKLRVLVPVAVIVALMLLLMAPAGALAAPDLHKGGGGGHSWHGGGGGGCNDGFSYRVRWGDTIGNIAWRFGVNSTYLAQVNGLCNPNRIYAGQYLWIPGNCW
jgi:LysM domain